MEAWLNNILAVFPFKRSVYHYGPTRNWFTIVYSLTHIGVFSNAEFSR